MPSAGGHRGGDGGTTPYLPYKAAPKRTDGAPPKAPPAKVPPAKAGAPCAVPPKRMWDAAGRPLARDPMAQRHALAAEVLNDIGAASLDAHLARRAV